MKTMRLEISGDNKITRKAIEDAFHIAQMDFLPKAKGLKITVEIAKTLEPKLGPTQLSRYLLEHHHIKLSRETLRIWMNAEGIYQSKKYHRTGLKNKTKISVQALEVV